MLLGIIVWSFSCTESVATGKLNNLALPLSAFLHFNTFHSCSVTRHKTIAIDLIELPSTLGPHFFTWALPLVTIRTALPWVQSEDETRLNCVTVMCEPISGSHGERNSQVCTCQNLRLCFHTKTTVCFSKQGSTMI